MGNTGAALEVRDDRAARDTSRRLRRVLERMQLARSGSMELDALLAAALKAAPPMSDCVPLRDVAAARCGDRWSTDLGDALTLLPPNYNFSVGCRDGVCWAWIQPNDRWEPSEYEARHDHPGGSGLVVAYTVALALTCAAIILRIRRADAQIRP